MTDLNNSQGKTLINPTLIKNKDKDMSSEIYKKLVIIVGEDRVSKSRLERLLYSHDLAPLPKEMSLAFKTVPDVVVKPRNALDVSRIIKYAVKDNIPVTPRGGATWALGGAVPTFGGIVLDMGSMQEILEINKENLYVTVEPGVDWMTLHDRLLNKGLLIGAYPSSAPGASVAGWVNTGGVGIGSYKYGGVEQQIRSMEIVLPNGDIINTGWTSVVNNSSGYNLNSLFVGSEGTLGIITKITLKVFPAPEEIRPVSFVFSDMGVAAEAVYALTQTNIIPYHISFLDGGHFDLLRELGKDAPGVGAMINMTFTGDSAIIDLEEDAATEIMTKYGGEKTSKDTAEHEWNERYFEAKSRRLGPGFLLGEGFCPISRFSDMVDKSKEVLNKLKMKGAVVGMICDRSTVLFMTYAIPNEHKLIKSMASMSLMKKLTDKIFEVGGRPAGFGMIYSGNLKKMHGKGVHVMDDIKSAIDPHYIMNPGKLTESTTRFGIPIPGFAMDIGMNLMAILKRIMPKDKLTPPSNEEQHETPPISESPTTEKPTEPIVESSKTAESIEQVDSQKASEPTKTAESSIKEKPSEP
ncbi:MAG: FAD-binding oxidoreductase, partial [Thermoplasmatales archaeon]